MLLVTLMCANMFALKSKQKHKEVISFKVFPLCRRWTLKLELQQSPWYELHDAFFMLAYCITLTGFEVKENILINQLISCISSFPVSRRSSRMLSIILTKIGLVLVWWAQILTLWETSCFDMSIYAFGLKPVYMMPTDSPIRACFRFIIIKLGICHLWSAITVHVEEVNSISLLHPKLFLSVDKSSLIYN